MTGKEPTESVNWDEAPTEVGISAAEIRSAVREDRHEEQMGQQPLSERSMYDGIGIPASLEPSLEHMSGPDVSAQPFRITAARTVIGRGKAADLQIHDRMVSKQHASILYGEGEFLVCDEKSTNGTLLNGLSVTEYAIRDGDRLLIGDTVLRFRLGRVE
jgi:hypothetical protein